MKIRIRAHDVKVTKALEAHVALRLGFALSRFGQQIRVVAVELSSSAEPRGHKESRCRIAVGLPRCVKVQESDADVFKAVTLAAERAARSITHALEQERTATQGSLPLWKDRKPRAHGAALLEEMARTGTRRASELKRRCSPAPPRRWRRPRDA